MQATETNAAFTIFADMGNEEVIGRLAAIPGLSDEAVRFIRAVGTRLTGAGVIDDVDEGGLRMLVMSYDMYVKASDELIRSGPVLRDKHGRITVNPAEKLTKTYYAQVLAFLREYGLTVRARERIKSLAPSEDEQSELFKFLTSRGDV